VSKIWLDYFMEIFGLKRVDIVEKKKRGRPLGSKNKKKKENDNATKKR
jgi:hypothetical protein